MKRAYRHTSISLTLGQNLKKAASVVLGQGDEKMKLEAEQFIRLINMDWLTKFRELALPVSMC